MIVFTNCCWLTSDIPKAIPLSAQSGIRHPRPGGWWLSRPPLDLEDSMCPTTKRTCQPTRNITLQWDHSSQFVQYVLCSFASGNLVELLSEQTLRKNTRGVYRRTACTLTSIFVRLSRAPNHSAGLMKTAVDYTGKHSRLHL